MTNDSVNEDFNRSFIKAKRHNKKTIETSHVASVNLKIVDNFFFVD